MFDTVAPLGLQTGSTQSGDSMARTTSRSYVANAAVFNQTKNFLTVIDAPDRMKRIDEACKPSALPPELLTPSDLCHASCNAKFNNMDEKELYLVPTDWTLLNSFRRCIELRIGH
jgi:hypothetical protein